jgi:N-glycosidase YbiA
LPTPGKAKQMGRKLQVRDGWDGMKLQVMEALLRQKFADPVLRQKLLDTGDAHLEEGNSWGDVWYGVCNGVGENHLGKLLMAIRDDLRSKGDALPLAEGGQP